MCAPPHLALGVIFEKLIKLGNLPKRFFFFNLSKAKYPLFLSFFHHLVEKPEARNGDTAQLIKYRHDKIQVELQKLNGRVRYGGVPLSFYTGRWNRSSLVSQKNLSGDLQSHERPCLANKVDRT